MKNTVKKRVISLLLILGVLLTSGGCGKRETEPDASDQGSNIFSDTETEKRTPQDPVGSQPAQGQDELKPTAEPEEPSAEPEEPEGPSVQELVEAELVNLLELRQGLVEQVRMTMSDGIGEYCEIFAIGGGEVKFPEQPQMSREALEKAVSSVVDGVGIPDEAIEVAKAASEDGLGGAVNTALDALGSKLMNSFQDAVFEAAGINAIVSASESVSSFADRLEQAMDTTPDYALSFSMAKANQDFYDMFSKVFDLTASVEDLETALTEYENFYPNYLTAANLKEKKGLTGGPKSTLRSDIEQIKLIDNAIALYYVVLSDPTVLSISSSNRDEAVSYLASLGENSDLLSDIWSPANFDEQNLSSAQGGSNMYGLAGSSSNPLAALFGSAVQYNIETDVSKLVTLIDSQATKMSDDVLAAVRDTEKYQAMLCMREYVTPDGLDGNAAAVRAYVSENLYDQDELEALRTQAIDSLICAILTMDSTIPSYEFYLSSNTVNNSFISELHSQRAALHSALETLGGSLQDVDQETMENHYRQLAQNVSDMAQTIQEGAFWTVTPRRTSQKRMSLSRYARSLAITTKDGRNVLLYDEPASVVGPVGFFIYGVDGNLLCFKGNKGYILYDDLGFPLISDYSASDADRFQAFARDFAINGFNISRNLYELPYWV